MTVRAPIHLALAATALALAPNALASQFVITEVTYTHSATTTFDSHYRVDPSAETPADWLSPVEYANTGSVWVRLEVFTKPSEARTRFQICFEATPSYACTDQSPIYTTPGVYTWSTPFTRFYQYSMVDWSMGVRRVALILKDDMNRKPSPENVGATISAMYMPTDLRVTVTAVSSGSTYSPPPDTMTDGGIDASTTTDAGSLDVVSNDAAGSLDVAARDVAMRVDTGAESVDGGTSRNDGGCGCRTPHGTRSGAALSLVVIATAVARRRRRRAFYRPAR